MNHIYKSIFNKALGVFTAVPEFASAHGKGSERTVVGRVAKGTAGFAASALAISVGLALTSTSAVAAPGIFINNGQDPACLAVIDDVATSALQLIYGGSKTIHPAVGVAAGSPLATAGNFELGARNPCLSTGGTGAENHDTQTNRSLFYNSKNLTLGGRLDVNSGIIGVGDRGTNGAGATNSIRMGTGTTLDEANKKINSIAIGVNTQATGENAITQGTESATYGKNSVSIGYKAVSGLTAPTASQTNAFSVSIGNETEAIDASTIAIGDKAKAKGGVDALAVGTQANAMTYKALAIGAYSQATGRQSTVIGNDIQGQPSIASGTRSQILGVQSNVSGDNSVSIGDTNTVASHRTYAIGNNINVAAGADDSLVFGTRAHADFSRSIAMGVNASTQGQTGVAIGDNAVTNGVNQISIGHKAGDVTETDNKKTRRPNVGNFGVMIGHYAGAEYTADEVTPVNHQHGTVAVGTQAGRAG